MAVGRPVDGVEVTIKDETDALVPSGEIGEIVLRSRFLAQGYWNNPELTATVFQTDPLDSSIRIYRTGDLGRWRSDGMLEHMGRKGRTIRLRGYNVEPFQVECELMRQRGVTDAIVLLHVGITDEKSYLVGYVVAPSHTLPSDIRRGLVERLPTYMVPSQIAVLDSFPILGSGKIDLAALPPPRPNEARVAFRAPSDDFERELLAIWQDVLKLSKIGIDDDFFELGGTSLQALTVFAQIEARLGCSLSPTAVMQAPTIAGLGELVQAPAAPQSLASLRTSGSGLPLFLVHSRYCFLTYYRHLVADLKSDRPVFGLQPQPLDGKHRIPRTIRIDGHRLRHANPTGSATRTLFSRRTLFRWPVEFRNRPTLVRQGERVSFLGLIDTIFHPTPIEKWPLLSEAAQLGRKARDARDFRDLLVRGLGFIRWQVLVGGLDFGSMMPDPTGRFHPLRAPTHLLRLALCPGNQKLCSPTIPWSHHDVQQRWKCRTTENLLGTARRRSADGS